MWFSLRHSKKAKIVSIITCCGSTALNAKKARYSLNMAAYERLVDSAKAKGSLEWAEADKDLIKPET